MGRLLKRKTSEGSLKNGRGDDDDVVAVDDDVDDDGDQRGAAPQTVM